MCYAHHDSLRLAFFLIATKTQLPIKENFTVNRNQNARNDTHPETTIPTTDVEMSDNRSENLVTGIKNSRNPPVTTIPATNAYFTSTHVTIRWLLTKHVTTTNYHSFRSGTDKHPTDFRREYTILHFHARKFFNKTSGAHPGGNNQRAAG